MDDDTSSPAMSQWMHWAKWSRGKAVGSYHPVLAHLIDVAMSAEALWRVALPVRWKERFAAALGVDIASAERHVVFWAGLHDLGKVCPGFQLQLERQNPSAHQLILRRLRAVGLSWRQVPWIAHGAVSARALRDILPLEYGYAQDLADEVAVAIGGHHGLFQSYGDLRRLLYDGVGDGRWHKARVDHAAWLAQAIELPSSPPPAGEMSHAMAMLLAGLVSVADWIGSSSFFTHLATDARQIPTCDIQTYRAHAQAKALEALSALGWGGWSPSADRLTFAQLFGVAEPRPLQQATIEIAEQLQGPAIVIVESPMGEGKTEAAMYLADHWGATMGQHGVYFALPTQATSNGMFERVCAFLEQRYPGQHINAQLLHGHAALSDTLKDLHDRWRGLLAPDQIYSGTTRPETMKGKVVAAEWFSSGKRALLAPFGVGTVDQALLAALQIMHVFVRHFGLSTKTVIVDEVHAYDAYMSTLLERLLEWLGAFDVPVVLLSATLPRRRREALLAAYAQGAGWEQSAPRTNTRYPRITWASSVGCDARQTAVSDLNRRVAQLEWLPGAMPAAGGALPFPLGERLLDLLAEGGCAAVICNTVNRAQRVYRALKPLFPGTASDGMPALDLLHARYPHEMRAEREQRILARFGKPAEGIQRPDRAIVVATQVIEQSLDLDFDLMVTDLAPADLILQRMGRLHRHNRDYRPPRLSGARILIIEPEQGADVAPIFDKGSEKVYDPHILLRSYLELIKHATLSLPDDIEPLVEAVYDSSVCSANVTGALRARWEDTLAELVLSQEAEAREAKNRYIKRPYLPDELANVVRDPREEDAPELRDAYRALTRLADETVSVVCLAQNDEGLSLRPGAEPFNLSRKPTREDVEALLRRSVGLSDRRVIRSLMEMAPPPHWDETSLLRQHRVLIFDAHGAAPIGSYRITLDEELGIVIE